jgi:hypothetical protein
MVGISMGYSSARGADEKLKEPRTGEAAKQAVSAEPDFIPGTPCRDGACQPRPAAACRDGDCLPRPMAGSCSTQPKLGHPPIGSYLDRLGRWFFYRNAPTPCECKGHFPSYRPPLIAWFPCKPGDCATHHSSYTRAVIVQPHPEAPPPLPPTPQITKAERPAGVSGSSAAMADKQPPVKKPEPTAKTTNGSSVNFRRTGTYADGIMPIESRFAEPSWEKSPK